MTTLAALISHAEGGWLDVLPAYQREPLQALLASGKSPDEVAESWIAAGSAEQTAPFGAEQSPRVFYRNFLNEIHDLLCTAKNREAEQDSVLQSFKSGQASVVAAISASISPYLASAPSFLVPAVAVVLAGIAQTSLSAWCQTQTERRKEEDSNDLSGQGS